MIFMHHSTFLEENTILEGEKEEIVGDFLLSTLLYCFKKKKTMMKHVQFQISSSSHERKEQSNSR